MSTNPLRVLVLSSFDDRDANVVRDFLFCFNKHSRHQYYYIFDPIFLGDETDFSAFDVILVFWGMHLPGVKVSLGATWHKLRQARALKVLFLQDEYRNVRAFNEVMSDLGIELMFTCVAEKDHKIFYPPDVIPSLRATYTVLTGYIPSYLENSRPETISQRPVDIAYRSRSLPYYLGDLAREKTIIAERFQQISLEYGFHSDISVHEEDRIYGDHWVEFLKSARFVLGTPSGASVIDFSGDISWNCDNYLYLHPNATYEEVKRCFFADVDGKYVIDTVSPRIFEATSLGSTMVMHEGFYGGILEADRHYICVKKDYSNINDVIEQMRDENYCQQIANNAYQDLIASGRYSYKTFVEWFDSVLDKHVYRTPIVHARAPSKLAFYAGSYFKVGQTLIPYLDRSYSLPFKNLIQKYVKAKRSLHNISILSQSSGLLPLFRKYMQEKHLGKGTLKQLPRPILLDLTCLSIIYQILNAKGTIQCNFQIRAETKPQEKRLRFISYQLEPKGSMKKLKTPYLDLAELMSAIRDEQILIDWDHSQIGTYVEYTYNSKVHSMNMGADGRYRFTALSFLAQSYPDLFADAFKPIYDALKNKE